MTPTYLQSIKIDKSNYGNRPETRVKLILSRMTGKKWKNYADNDNWKPGMRPTFGMTEVEENLANRMFLQVRSPQYPLIFIPPSIDEKKRIEKADFA